MDNSLPAGEWLTVLRREYLQDFIKSGGAAVKFVVPVDGLAPKALVEQLRQAAKEDGYLFAHVDAALTKVHMIDKVFNAIAEQVDWDDQAHRFLRLVLSKKCLLPEPGQDLILAGRGRMGVAVDLGS